MLLLDLEQCYEQAQQTWLPEASTSDRVVRSSICKCLPLPRHEWHSCQALGSSEQYKHIEGGKPASTQRLSICGKR